VLTLTDIRNTRQRLDDYIVTTPVWHWHNREIAEAAGEDTQVYLKLELFQHTGTFKPRGALNVMLDLDRATLDRGVTAVSAGNHAIAVAYAARRLHTTAKVVMIETANPARIAACKAYGAELLMAGDAHAAFQKVHEIEADEGRAFVHPFEGPLTSLGTATVGLELMEQVPDLHAVIVPIGGGGLCSGVAAAVKLMNSDTQVFGVEPEGADTMHRSFESGKPESIDKVRTIADSLGAPHASPYSFELCRTFVDELVRITDDDMASAMGLLFRGMKLAVEPAGAAATAALCGPLRDKLRGKRVGVIVCGTNIDPESFARHVDVFSSK
jgi:threonine dehydratase